MGYSNETPNYHLPQYLADDRPSYLGDWNEAMGLIDGGMNDNKIAIANTDISVANMRQYVDNNVNDINTTIEGVNTTINGVNDQIADVNTRIDGVSATAGTALDTANEALAKTKIRKVLFIGDSYARMEDAGQISWCNWLADRVGAESYTTYAEGGAGFFTKGISGNSFLTLANKAVTEITDKSDYDLIVIAGGRNDGASAPYNDYYNGARSVFNVLNNSFSNARKIVVPLLWSHVRDYSKGYFDVAGAFLEAAVDSGWEGVNWAWTWGLGEDAKYDGGIHPLSAGGELIANYMYQAYMGSYSGRTLYTRVSGFGSGDCIAICTGGTVTFMIGGTYNDQDAELPNAITFKSFGSTWGVVYADGGSSTAVLILGNSIAIYNGGNKGNIGGSVTFPW